jgi:class 3 adenylate cyclase
VITSAGVPDASCVVRNGTTGCVQYVGRPLEVATAVCSAGHDSTVLITEATFEAVR